jgi:hypothetical protein
MQTRQYPRTLNEAFPRTAEYGCAVERTRPAFRWTPIRITLCAVYAAALVTLGVVL